MKIEQDYAGFRFSYSATVLGNKRDGGFTIRQYLQHVRFADRIEGVTEDENVCQIVFDDEDFWATHADGYSLGPTSNED